MITPGAEIRALRSIIRKLIESDCVVYNIDGYLVVYSGETQPDGFNTVTINLDQSEIEVFQRVGVEL